MNIILCVAWVIGGVFSLLSLGVIVIITRGHRPVSPTTTATTTPPGCPPPLPPVSFWRKENWFRTLVILTTIGSIGAIIFVPQVQSGLGSAWDYCKNHSAFGIGAVLIVVMWFSYNYLNPLPPGHIINARIAMFIGLVCLGIWGWQLIGPNKLQHIGNWWKEFARILPSLVVGANQPPHPVRPSQKVFLTNQQSVHPSSPHSQIVTVKVSSGHWIPIEWLPDYNDEVFGSPRPVRVLYCRQRRMPDENQRPDGVMEKEGENPSDIPASISPLWVKAESKDPDTEVEFNLLVGFSR